VQKFNFEVFDRIPFKGKFNPMPVCSNITYAYDSGIFFVETQFLSVTIVRMTVTPIFAKLALKKETMRDTGSMFS
jgi:hypothetical protein